MNYSSIKTPQRAYADFCLIPVGTGSPSVAKEVAEVQRLLKASGLKYTMHSAGTTVGKSGVCALLSHLVYLGTTDVNTEGSWDEVFKVIGQAHSLVHQTGAVRVQTSMRVGTR
jgi:uncharacterized protein YqgV (UPF0045/DUF77 family)